MYNSDRTVPARSRLTALLPIELAINAQQTVQVTVGDTHSEGERRISSRLRVIDDRFNSLHPVSTPVSIPTEAKWPAELQLPGRFLTWDLTITDTSPGPISGPMQT